MDKLDNKDLYFLESDAVFWGSLLPWKLYC